MKSLELGTYKFVKQPNQHTRWYQRLWAKIVWYTKVVIRILTIGGVTGAILYSTFLIGQYSAPAKILAQQAVADATPAKIESLKNDLINQIGQLESGNSKTSDALIKYDNNSKGTLSQKDAPSIGCMQFKVGTIQHYAQILDNKTLSNYDATLIALNCDQAKAFAKRVIFDTQGGLWNWSVATKEMGTKVEIIKELSK